MSTVSAAINVTVLECAADKSVVFKVTEAQNKFVYIDGCESSEGENNANGLESDDEDVTFNDCGLQWDTDYQVQVTVNQGVTTGSDFRKNIRCNRVNSTITAFAKVTVSASPATVSNQAAVNPTATMIINLDSSDYTAPAVSTVQLGTPLTIHIRLDDEFISDFDIQAAKITLNNGGIPVTLTGESTKGCKSKQYWADVIDAAVGYLKVDYEAFKFTKTGNVNDMLTFTATLEVCAGAPCGNFPCSGGIFAGRRRRDISNNTLLEEINVSSTINVVSYETTAAESGSAEETGFLPEETGTSLDVCLDKNGFYGLIIAFVLALLLSIVASCFLFQKARRKLRLQDKEHLYYRSSVQSNNSS